MSLLRCARLLLIAMLMKVILSVDENQPPYYYRQPLREKVHLVKRKWQKVRTRVPSAF